MVEVVEAPLLKVPTTGDTGTGTDVSTKPDDNDNDDDVSRKPEDDHCGTTSGISQDD